MTIYKCIPYENEIAFFPLRGITSSASRPEIPQKNIFHNVYQKKGVDLLLQEDAFEIGHTY